MSKIHSAHILVQHQYEAEDILKKLQASKSKKTTDSNSEDLFGSLARKHSICSSAANSGDLGEIDSRRLDPDFVEACEALKAGQISEKPVRTKFGYHIIKRIS